MKKKTWIIVLVILVIIVAAVFRFVPRFQKASGSRPEDISGLTGSYTVGRGDVEVTITGSGTLKSQDTVDITLPEGVKVDTIFVKAGDIVSQGDVLATLNSASLQYQAAKLSAELSELDDKLGTRKLTSSIKAPVKGRIKYLPASEDNDVIETVNQYGSLAILSTDGLMQLNLQTDSVLVLSTEVTVRWNGGNAKGKVASRVDGGYIITLSDAKAPYLETAEVYMDAALIGSGTLEIHAPLAVFGNGGTVKKIYYKVNDAVEMDAILFTLDNEPATDTYRKNLSDRKEKATQLQTILMYQKSPNVLATASGTVNDIQATEGKKTVSSDNSGEMTAFTLGTGGAVKMTVKVDELDISNVAVGQNATVTLDAFSTETFNATVTRISHIGTASGSITTYETDLILDKDDRLMQGMNGSAVILANSVQNAVVVPLAAVHEDANGSYVNKASFGGASKTYIKTGLSDGTNAEVTSGLNEGDQIIYTPAGTNTSEMMFGGGYGESNARGGEDYGRSGSDENYGSGGADYGAGGGDSGRWQNEGSDRR